MSWPIYTQEMVRHLMLHFVDIWNANLHLTHLTQNAYSKTIPSEKVHFETEKNQFHFVAINFRVIL